MPKNNEIRFKVEREEYDNLKRKAKKIGMTIASYCRFIALNSTITPINIQGDI